MFGRIQVGLRQAVLLAVIATFTTACNSREKSGAAADTATSAANAPSGGAPDTGAMGAMPGMATESGRMMAEMQTHFRALDGASADSLRATLPAHRQMVANMISQMNREMRDMSMTADAAWDATVDSLRRDLTHMPELSAGELAAMMPAHRGRVERLMVAHREMLRRMGR